MRSPAYLPTPHTRSCQLYKSTHMLTLCRTHGLLLSVPLPVINIDMNLCLSSGTQLRASARPTLELPTPGYLAALIACCCTRMLGPPSRPNPPFSPSQASLAHT